MARRSWDVRLISGSLLPMGAGAEGPPTECRRPLTAGSGSGLFCAAAWLLRAAVRSGICVTSVAITSGGIYAALVVLTGRVLTGGHRLAGQTAVPGDRFRWTVAG